MFRRIPHLLSGLLLLALTSALARAQVDHRVNQGNAARAGHALDANPGRGTGGLNRPSGRFDAGGYADAVITGNVTGLGRFQAYSPVLQTNQFRASLPSAGLSSFEGASVGVGDVLSNRGLTSTRYYGVQQTVSDVGFIRAGMNAPGSSQLASPYAAPPRAGVLPSGEMTPVGGGVFDRAVGADGEMSSIGIIRQEGVAPRQESRDITVSPPALGFRRAAESSIFGMPPSPFAREGGLEEARSPFDRTPPGGLRGLPAQEELAPPTDSAGAVMAVTPGAPPASPEAARSGLAGEEPSPSGVTVRAQTPAAEVAPPTGVVQAPPQIGQDPYSDLVGAVRTAAAHGLKKMVLDAGDTLKPAGGEARTTPASADEAEALPPAPAARPRLVLEGVADLAAAAKWAGDLLENPVSTFAGRHEDRLNQYIASGEEAMRNGEYYRAVGLFELAQTVDPRNPLPWLHRGHALVAAGQYMSAAWSLEQGIKRFPEIAAFRLDLPSFGGQQAIFDTRRADLEKRLAIAEHYQMRFLLGYLELYSGLPEEGLRDLDLAAKAAPPESVIAVFADVLSGRTELPISNDHAGRERTWPEPR